MEFISSGIPSPITDFRQVLAVLVNVLLVLDEFVLHLLFQIGALGPQVRQPVHHVLNKVESVEIVLHPYVEGGRDRPFLLVAPDMKIPIRSTVSQPVDEPRVTVEAKYDMFVSREK